MKYFKNAITSWEDWQIWILNPLLNRFKSKTDSNGNYILPEWIDDTKSFYSQEDIYDLFASNYADMVVRYPTKEDFARNLRLVLLDQLPKLFVATLAFANNEFQKLLIADNRGDITSESMGSTSKQKLKQGIPPSNLKVVSDLSDLNIKNAQYLENAIKDQHLSQYTNLLVNLKQIIASNVNGVILDWLKGFSFLFTSLVTDEFNWSPKLTDILYELEKNMDYWNQQLAEFDQKFQDLEDLVNSDDDNEKTLGAQVVKNTTNIATNTTNIATNTTNITNLQNQQNTNTSNITTLQNQQKTNASDISTLQTQLSNISNNYVTISTSQILTGAKYFTNGLIIRQKEGYSGYIQFQNEEGDILDNIGFIKEADTLNALLTFSFQKSKVINVPSYDLTSQAFGDNSLVTKKYVDQALTNGSDIQDYLNRDVSNTVTVSNNQQFQVEPVLNGSGYTFAVNYDGISSGAVINYDNVTNDKLTDNSLVPKSYVDNLSSLKSITIKITSNTQDAVFGGTNSYYLSYYIFKFTSNESFPSNVKVVYPVIYDVALNVYYQIYNFDILNSQFCWLMYQNGSDPFAFQGKEYIVFYE